MSYVDLDFTKRVLRDDYLVYPDDMADYDNFAKAEINARLANTYTLPFDDITKYAVVPSLINWIAAYLVGYKLYDERASLEGLSENSKGREWWDMAQAWLTGLVDGSYLLHLPDGTVIDILGSITAPRFYPNGVRDKAPSTDNVPYFNRAQAGEW